MPEPLKTAASSTIELHDAISVLRRYSLIDVTKHFISIHRLVQVVVRRRLKEREYRQFSELARRIEHGVDHSSYADESPALPLLWDALIDKGHAILTRRNHLVAADVTAASSGLGKDNLPVSSTQAENAAKATHSGQPKADASQGGSSKKRAAFRPLKRAGVLLALACVVSAAIWFEYKHILQREADVVKRLLDPIVDSTNGPQLRELMKKNIAATLQSWGYVRFAVATVGKRVLKPGNNDAFKDCEASEKCPEMVVVPADEFFMGSENGNDANEKPRHKVTIGRPFAVSKYEVTFEEWKACVNGGGCGSNKNPGNQGWGEEKHPVVNGSWTDVKQYVEWLSGKTGHPYRLLTEAEWEYAARAGTSTPYALGNGNSVSRLQAQFDGSKTVEVGTFEEPNAWGLYDMHGNVWEWVEDCYEANYDRARSDGSAPSTLNCSARVFRGGSFANSVASLRSANRARALPTYTNRDLGFRVARTL
jgi:formylglycine-generating enzyme required for sulfatase activity